MDFDGAIKSWYRTEELSLSLYYLAYFPFCSDNLNVSVIVSVLDVPNQHGMKHNITWKSTE